MGISMNGFDELIIAFDELSEMPDSVLDGMLAKYSLNKI